jgi:dihydroxyacid dehydratase/phosphogluconate dehydratase
MDAKTNIEARLPSRHVTEEPASAARRSYCYAVGLTAEARSDAAKVFKRPPYLPDSRPVGRHVAKDMFEVAGTPHLMRTLLDCGHLHDASSTVTCRAVAETMNSVKCPDQDVVRSDHQPVTATAVAHEMGCHANA